MMELILWRHAEAEAGEPDFDRALTPKGHKQAARMAAWLDLNLPNSCRILVSPTRRTIQTAEALGRKFRIFPAVGPDASALDLLEAVNWPLGREPALIVGHQPALGKVVAQLLTGSQQEWPMRKSSAWWFVQKERKGEAFNYLKAVMTADLVAK
ncbi:phosphohistidine phosphatase SixA [soil metagenome]